MSFPKGKGCYFSQADVIEGQLQDRSRGVEVMAQVHQMAIVEVAPVLGWLCTARQLEKRLLQTAAGVVARVDDAGHGLDERGRQVGGPLGKVVLRHAEARLDDEQVGVDGIEVMAGTADFARKAADVRDNLVWALAQAKGSGHTAACEAALTWAMDVPSAAHRAATVLGRAIKSSW